MATVSNNVKSKRPADSAFKQQRLSAWQPILTAGTVLPTFFIIGLAFIPIGIGLLYFSDEVKEKVVDYTYCKNSENKQCADVIANNSAASCTCNVPFTIEVDMKKDVFIYYGLSNFYQNHRRYVKSRDDLQLLGKLSSKPSTDCDPFAYSEGKPIAPCGAIANSLFNDTLEIFSHAQSQTVPVFRTGIAWPSDKDIKFRNPPGNIELDFSSFAKPLAWSKPVYELDPKDPSNNGFQNEDLIVWMRTAALPSFRKLYRRVDHSKEGYKGGLSRGNYSLIVDYRYGVVEFGGSKRLVISNTSVLGGKNPFLGIAYIVVGGVCLLLALVFLIIHIKCGKKLLESGSIVSHSADSQELYCTDKSSPTFHCLICHSIFFSLPSLKAHLVLDHKLVTTQLDSILDLTLAYSQQHPLSNDKRSENEALNGENDLTPVLPDNMDLIMDWTRLKMDDLSIQLIQSHMLQTHSYDNLPSDHSQAPLSNSSPVPNLLESISPNDSLECSLLPTVESLDLLTSTDELIQDLTDEDLYAVSKDIDLELGFSDVTPDLVISDQPLDGFYDHLLNINSTFLPNQPKGWFGDG